MGDGQGGGGAESWAMFMLALFANKGRDGQRA